jgi:sulfite exporter TauE/SafE
MTSTKKPGAFSPTTSPRQKVDQIAVMSELTIAAALTLGFLGSSHCLVMCGGIGAALGLGNHGTRGTLLLFQLGRVLSYACLGGILGALAGIVAADSIFALNGLRVIAGLLLIAMGCYISNWWRGLVVLERAGQLIWRRVQPITSRFLPIQKPQHALLVGMSWGLLPCGLIYSALAWSATAADWRYSALLMFCFGLGTIPAMLATSYTAEQFKKLMRSHNLRRTAAILLIIFGSWTSIMALQHTIHHTSGEHGNNQASQHDKHNRS